MQIDEAIKVVRSVARQKRAHAATTNAHPFAGEAYARYVAARESLEAEALEAVCNELEMYIRYYEKEV